MTGQNHNPTPSEPQPGPAKPGDLFVCRETADFAVQWLIVAELPSGAVSVVPVDAHPIIGRWDVAIEDTDYDSDLVARCDHVSDALQDLFQPHLRTGSIDREGLNRVRTAIEGRAANEMPPRDDEDRALAEIDTSPEYEDWIDENVLPALGRLGKAPSVKTTPEARIERELDFVEHSKRTPVRSEPTNRSSYPSLRAAAVLAIGVGLGLLAGLWLFGNIDNRPEPAIEANIPVFLLAEAETERAGSSTPKLPFPDGHDSMTIALSAIDAHLHDRYRIDAYSLADLDQEALVLDGLTPDAQGLLTLRLQDGDRWRQGALFELFADSTSTSEPLASYRLEFE